MANRPEHKTDFPISALRSTLPESSVDDDPMRDDELAAPDLIMGDVSETSSALSSVPTSASTTPVDKSPEQQALEDLLTPTAHDHLTEKPGKPTRLTDEYTFPVLGSSFPRVADCHDPEKHHPCVPSGSEQSAFMRAHIDHKNRFEAEKPMRALLKALDDFHLESYERRQANTPRESSWWKKQMIDRVPLEWDERQREWNKRNISATPTPTSPLERASTASSTATAERSSSQDCFGYYDTTVLEPLRKIIAHPDSKVQLVGTPLAERERVHGFAERMRSHLTGSKSSGSSILSKRDLQAGEEYDVVDGEHGVYDELEELFDEPDAPVGIFDEYETAYWYSRDKLKLAGKAKKAGCSDEEVEGWLREHCDMGKEEIEELVKAARTDLISKRKLLPEKPKKQPARSGFKVVLKRKRSDPSEEMSDEAVGGTSGEVSPTTSAEGSADSRESKRVKQAH